MKKESMKAAFCSKTNACSAVRQFGRILVCAAVASALAFSLILAGCSSGKAASSAASSASPMASSSSSSASSSASTKDNKELFDVTLIIRDAENDSVATSYPVSIPSDEATVLNVLYAANVDAVAEEGQYGAYVSSILGMKAEGDKGWIYTLNGEVVMESVDICQVANGDTVEFSYSTLPA